MKVLKLQFPQISRLFSATLFQSLLFWSGNAILWSLLVSLFCFNALSRLQMQNSLSSYLSPVLSDPYSAQIHMKVASTLWKQGFHNQAKKELSLARDLEQKNEASVLGASTTPDELLNLWNSQPQKLNEDYTYWKSIAEKLPNYRDAYIQAGSLAILLGKTKEAKYLLEQSHELDSNDKTTNDLLSTLKN